MNKQDQKGVTNSTITGEQLRALRLRSNKSVSEVSRKIGVSRQAISDWENDVGKARWNTFLAYLSVCGVSNIQAVFEEVYELVTEYRRSKKPVDSTDSEDSAP